MKTGPETHRPDHPLQVLPRRRPSHRLNEATWSLLQRSPLAVEKKGMPLRHGLEGRVGQREAHDSFSLFGPLLDGL